MTSTLLMAAPTSPHLVHHQLFAQQHAQALAEPQVKLEPELLDMPWDEPAPPAPAQSDARTLAYMHVAAKLMQALHARDLGLTMSAVDGAYALAARWPHESLDEFVTRAAFISDVDTRVYTALVAAAGHDPLVASCRSRMPALLAFGTTVVTINEQAAMAAHNSEDVDVLTLVAVKLQVAQTLRADVERIAHLVHLAGEVDRVVINRLFLTGLLSRWRTLNFGSVRHAADWSAVGSVIVDTVFVNFPSQLYTCTKHASVPASDVLVAWFRKVLRFCLENKGVLDKTTAHNMPSNLGHLAGVFLMMWLRVMALVRDDLLRDNTSALFAEDVDALMSFCQHAMSHIVHRRLADRR